MILKSNVCVCCSVFFLSLEHWHCSKTMRSHPRLCHFAFSPCWLENEQRYLALVVRPGNAEAASEKPRRLVLMEECYFSELGGSKHWETEGLLMGADICWHMILNLLVKAEGQPSTHWSPLHSWCFTNKPSILKRLYLSIDYSAKFEMRITCIAFSLLDINRATFFVPADFHLTKYDLVHLNIF